MVEPKVGAEELDRIYAALNRREYVHPDPLEFLYSYEDLKDREVAGIVSASLAYGRVKQILASVERVLRVLGPSPAAFLSEARPGSLEKALAGFKHRFTTGEEMVLLLRSVSDVQSANGSLGELFARLVRPDEETVVPAMERFTAALRGDVWCGRSSVLPEPTKGSACKRLHLFLRWMVRRDEVDPGGWNGVPASKLVVPLDTHMHRIGRMLGLTGRAQADIRTALELTGAFRGFAPDDPVKYDFALTRLGIRDDVTIESMLPGAAAGAR